MKVKESQCFALGFVISAVIILTPLHIRKTQQQHLARQKIIHRFRLQETEKVYDEVLSSSLFDDVKVLCMVMTHPENHQKRAIHVRNTWGSRCNKLVFMSSKLDLQLDTVVLELEESRDTLWNKTKLSFQYAYDNYLADYDWFLKADDDNFIIMENLRYMLAQYNPKTALYFGHRYSVPNLEEGYMAGGGYILSKKALQKFVEVIARNESICQVNAGAEDMAMGRCLKHSAIFVDARDEVHEKRFFPVGVEEHMKESVDPNYWYTMNQYYHVTQGRLNCCSETSTEYHYISAHEMYLLHYFIYDVHPFGIDDHSTETLPRKLSLQEIIAASDAKSLSPNFKVHKNYHQLDQSETEE